MVIVEVLQNLSVRDLHTDWVLVGQQLRFPNSTTVDSRIC